MSQQVLDPARLIVRCVAQPIDGSWQAFSLEFGLAAQGDSFPDVKAKLQAMIWSYVYDALVGDDKAHARELLARRGPWWVYVRYHLARLRHRRHLETARTRAFSQPMPLQPAASHC